MPVSSDPRLAYPKGEPRKRVKGRARRHEGKVKTSVRATVATREEHRCRLWPAAPGLLGLCSGTPQWAHLEDGKRFKTRGQPADRRHTTAASCLLCAWHHDAYDRGVGKRGKLRITFLTDRGANGPMRFERAGVVYEEPNERP